MTASQRLGRHIRGNVVGYVAVFIALTGSSYAATQVTSKDIEKNAVKAKHIKDGQVGTAEVADDGLTGADIDEGSLQNVPVVLADGSVTTLKLADQAVTIPKLAFDPATQAELDAAGAELDALATPGTLNAGSNPVDFSKLKNVPAGFADGVDNTGAAPANNSLGAAEPPAADDQIVDGSIDAQDVDDPVRQIELPLLSWFNGSDDALIDFAASDGSAVDLVTIGGNGDALGIEWDADTDADPNTHLGDTDVIETTFTAPSDYASGETIVVRASKPTSGGALEILACSSSINNGTYVSAGVDDVTGTTVNSYALNGGNTPAPGDAVSVRCQVHDQTAPFGDHNDPVRIHSVAWRYTAAQ